MAEVSYQVRDGVAHVVLDAPQRRNALTPEMADELVEAFERVDRDPAVGAVVVSGRGGAFCAGAALGSLEGVMTDPTSAEAYASISRIYDAFLRLGALEVPSVAALRGPAVGAGFNLALAADVRVAAEDARLISGFGKMGLHPGGGHFSLLAKSASPEVAAAMGIFGQEVSGRRAAELGLVWEAVSDAAVEERAHQLASAAGRDPELARFAVTTLRATAGSGASWPTAVLAERAPQLWSLGRAGRRAGAAG